MRLEEMGCFYICHHLAPKVDGMSRCGLTRVGIKGRPHGERH
jgi:hypothetical protein